MTDKRDLRHERMTKKEKKGSIAEQFMRDDYEKMYSKKKFEKVNDRLRRMGTKKAEMKRNKRNKRSNQFKSKDGGKDKKGAKSGKAGKR